ncbi:PAS domain-containing protein [Yersinia enterocolitica]|uniref:helix-turn-helix transcriptional regulator n=1 Tax=Yersinia enterocolitica TaxID=630 RepID=UPI001C8E5488|nr:PAS domain-containing protein [Yersinia enterocolitica]MBX9475233.1 PAS domain-containing protein [Yersinia enterocolitica]
MSEKDRIDLHGRSQGDFHIPVELIHSWKDLNEPFGIKDSYSRFIYANPAYLELLNLPKDFDIVGRLDSELPTPIAEFAEQFQYHERKVEMERQRISSLEIHRFSGNEFRAYFFDRYPYINQDGHIIGTIFHGRVAEFIPLSCYVQSGFNDPQPILFKKPSDIFTDAEWSVVFFALQNFSQKEIATSLGLKQKTINNRLDSIYKKARVSGLCQLINYIMENKLENYIPERLLRSGHYIMNIGQNKK